MKTPERTPAQLPTFWCLFEDPAISEGKKTEMLRAMREHAHLRTPKPQKKFVNTVRAAMAGDHRLTADAATMTISSPPSSRRSTPSRSEDRSGDSHHGGAHHNGITHAGTSWVADDRAVFVDNDRVVPVADGRADSGTDGCADPAVVARADLTRSGSVGEPPTPAGCSDPGVVARVASVADDRAACVDDW